MLRALLVSGLDSGLETGIEPIRVLAKGYISASTSMTERFGQ